MMEGWKLPEGWGWEILDKVAPEDSQQIFPPDYSEQEFNYWGLEAIEKNQFDEPQPNFVPGSSIQSTCVKFDNQHVLYCKLRPYLNKVIVPSVSGIGSTEWVPLKPDPNILERKFLAFYLRSPQFLSYSTKNVTGARMPRMSKTALKKTSIPIPFLSDPPRSLAEQRRIVAQLEALLGEVKAMREQVQTLQRDINRLMESALAEVFPSVGQPLPEGWEWKELNSLVTIKYGNGLSQRFRIYGSVPVYGANGIIGYHNAAITRGETIIIGRKGSAGAVSWSDVPCWPIDTTFFIDEFPKNIFSRFLYHFLHSQNLERLQQSAAIPGLNREILYRVLIPLPYPDDPTRSLAEQRRIVAYLDDIQQAVREAQELIQSDLRAVEQLEQSILAAAFGGEV